MEALLILLALECILQPFHFDLHVFDLFVFILDRLEALFVKDNMLAVLIR